MNAHLLACLLKRIPRIKQGRSTCYRILPYVFCSLLLLTSSCFWKFDRDGPGPHDGHDRDQHHDHERYNLQDERERHGMNLKQDDYTLNEFSGQG